MVTWTLAPVEVNPRDRVLLDQIGRLRVRAWTDALPARPTTNCWLDGFELASRHWCVFHEGELVAAARMSIHQRIGDLPDAKIYARVLRGSRPGPIVSFNRLVVAPNFRGQGFSDDLDRVRMAAAASVACSSWIANTPTGPWRLMQFRAHGFVPIGDPVPFPAGHFLTGLRTQVVIRYVPADEPPRSAVLARARS